MSNQPAQDATPLEQPVDAKAFLDLSSFSSKGYSSGRSKVVELLWYYCSLFVMESGFFPFYKIKVWLLRQFGAQIGTGVVIKPNVRIKYPWRLVVGDHCWIGQGSWIDNIEDVTVGDHVCISQLVYFCTGSHDHRISSFDLTAKPIVVQNGAWVGAGALVLGGITVEANAIVAAGSIVTKDPQAGSIVGGNPAKVIGKR